MPSDGEQLANDEPPMRPEGPLQVSEVTDSSVRLQWYPPQEDGTAGPITGYIVDARQLDDLDVISQLELVECTFVTVQGLESGRLYQFRVYSENDAGISDPLLGPRSLRIQSGLGKHYYWPAATAQKPKIDFCRPT